MRVLITRKAGDKLAPDVIVDTLCTTTLVGTERGKAYLYQTGFDKKMYELTLPYRRPIYPTDTVTIHDGTVGESFVGRVTRHEIQITQSDGAISIDSTVTVERNEEFV